MKDGPEIVVTPKRCPDCYAALDFTYRIRMGWQRCPNGHEVHVSILSDTEAEKRLQPRFSPGGDYG